MSRKARDIPVRHIEPATVRIVVGMFAIAANSVVARNIAAQVSSDKRHTRMDSLRLIHYWPAVQLGLMECQRQHYWAHNLAREAVRQQAQPVRNSLMAKT